MTVFAFGNNPSPTNLITLCKNDVVHSMMSNALLLITQQRHRRKTQNNRGRAAVCVRACVIRRLVQQYVCVHLAEDRCWQKTLAFQQEKQIEHFAESRHTLFRPRGQLKKKACYWQLKSQTLSDGAFLAVSDQRHG